MEDSLHIILNYCTLFFGQNQRATAKPWLVCFSNEGCNDYI